MFKSLKRGFKKQTPEQSQATQQPAQPRMAQRARPANGAVAQKRKVSGLPDSYLDIDNMFK